MSDETYSSAQVTEALAKISSYRVDFGDWILVATPEAVLSRAQECKDEALTLDADSTRSQMLRARAQDLEAIADYIRICDTRRALLIPAPLPLQSEAKERTLDRQIDVMQYTVDELVDETVGLVTHFGSEVLLLDPDDWRKLALESLTQSTAGTILDTLTHLSEAIQYNHIARVRQRAQDLDICLDDYVEPPQLSLSHLRTPPRQPLFKYGDIVYETVVLDVTDEDGTTREIKTVSEAVVIAISQDHDRVKYRLGNLVGEDTIYPMEGYVDEELLSLERPVLPDAVGETKRRPSFLKVVK